MMTEIWACLHQVRVIERFDESLESFIVINRFSQPREGLGLIEIVRCRSRRWSDESMNPWPVLAKVGGRESGGEATMSKEGEKGEIMNRRLKEKGAPVERR